MECWMESGKKKIKSEIIRRISGVYKGVSEALKRVFPRKNRILEITLVLLLLILGLALYLTLSKEKEYTYERFEYINKELNEGINAYRLEDFDKAEILLLNVFLLSYLPLMLVFLIKETINYYEVD